MNENENKNVNNEISIDVKNVTKIYSLYKRPSDRLIDTFHLMPWKKYPKNEALKDVSFTVKKGETVGIIGTNGSGKSTVLKIITGVLTPTKGKAVVNGRISALLELGAGFNAEYTGIENVYLNCTMMGLSKEETEKKLPEILDFADIGEYVYSPVKTYSSGMFVRLAFAVAINIDPEILIVDEALSVGDVFFQAKCYRKFEDFKRQGKTILFVSHDLSSIAKYCDRVVLLNKGDKLGEGSPKEMIDLYKQVLVGQYKDEKNAVVKEGLNTDTLEYGSKKAKILDCKIYDNNGRNSNAIIKGTSFKIAMEAEVLEDLEAPIFAFTFKNVQGTEITGTNTMIEKSITEGIRGGSKLTIEFTQDMNLQGGEYLLSLGLTGFEKGEFTVYHRLYDCINVTVVSDKDSVGYYDMNSKVDIKYH
ncbi:MAG: ABC transporter ATP-binding protein [Lachnospiraceae bacterium]|nr:ABC transporter ATP-binding protein [Lachnospiraceae bacterium]